MPQVPFNHVSKQITANGGSVTLNVSGFGSLGIEVGGTFTGTLAFKGRIGNAFVDLAAATPADPTTTVASTSAVGTWLADVAGLTEVEIIATAFSAGAAKVDLLAAA